MHWGRESPSTCWALGDLLYAEVNWKVLFVIVTRAVVWVVWSALVFQLSLPQPEHARTQTRPSQQLGPRPRMEQRRSVLTEHLALPRAPVNVRVVRRRSSGCGPQIQLETAYRKAGVRQPRCACSSLSRRSSAASPLHRVHCGRLQWLRNYPTADPPLQVCLWRAQKVVFDFSLSLSLLYSLLPLSLSLSLPPHPPPSSYPLPYSFHPPPLTDIFYMCAVRKRRRRRGFGQEGRRRGRLVLAHFKINLNHLLWSLSLLRSWQVRNRLEM